MHEPSFAELSALAAEHMGCTFEDDPSATIELAVVGLTVRAWRNTSLEDLHAADRGGGGFSDISMMRFNIATTRVVSKFVGGRGVDWRGLHSALTNPGRALPGGRTVGELTGDSFDRLAGDVESVVIRTSFTESQRGVAYMPLPTSRFRLGFPIRVGTGRLGGAMQSTCSWSDCLIGRHIQV